MMGKKICGWSRGGAGEVLDLCFPEARLILAILMHWLPKLKVYLLRQMFQKIFFNRRVNAQQNSRFLLRCSG